MTKIDGGICAAKGFKASGTYCGIKKPAVENPNPDYVHKNDICLVACDVLCNTAAVYTQNKVKGAPILVTKDHLAKSGNKAKAIIAKNYGDDLFEEVRGLREGEAPKPDPHVVAYFIEKYGLDKAACLFVGDSLPDLLTAQNAGLPLCLCEWGYGFYKPELLQEAKYVIKKPKELAQFIL